MRLRAHLDPGVNGFVEPADPPQGGCEGPLSRIAVRVEPLFKPHYVVVPCSQRIRSESGRKNRKQVTPTDMVTGQESVKRFVRSQATEYTAPSRASARGMVALAL